MAESAVRYQVDGRIARITLCRPQCLNAISPTMPQELRICVEQANRDDRVHVIVLSGDGNAFCAGYDLQAFAASDTPTTQQMPWDSMVDYHLMKANTDDFMSLWRSSKPTICKVHGYAVAGGSDIALCCDIIIMEDGARIGYPPARVWGCPTTAMWTFRVGAEWAKRILFTGALLTGEEAVKIGLVSESVPRAELDEKVEQLAQRIASVPKNQLAMVKSVINQVVQQQGLEQAQMLSTLFDGIARHSPEGIEFKRQSESEGFKAAVHARDSGEPIYPQVSRNTFDRGTRTIIAPLSRL